MPGQEFVDTLLKELAAVQASNTAVEERIAGLFDEISRLESENKERYNLQVHLEALLKFYVPAPVSQSVEETEQSGEEATEPIPLADRLVLVLQEAGEPVSIGFAQNALTAAGVTLRGPRPRALVAAILARSPRFLRNEQGLYTLANRS